MLKKELKRVKLTFKDREHLQEEWLYSVEECLAIAS